jgi:hypothetical protein
MERNHVIVIAVVVASLALFGLKVWSDRAADSDLAPGRQAAAARLARAGGQRGDSDAWGSGSSEGAGGRGDRPGSLRSGGLGGSGLPGARGGGLEGRGGSAELAHGGGGARVGSAGLGYSGSGASSGGSGGGVDVVGGEGAGHVAPRAQQKDNLVQFLSSQPPTQGDLASAKNADGEDVALKIDKPDDIAKQGGQEQNVQAADNGDGIKITDATTIKFPNNVNPDGFTISFKISPDWSGNDPTDNALLEMRGANEWANRVELVKNGEYLRFIVTTDSQQEQDISVRINDWPAGQERELQAQVNLADGKGTSELFMDGQLAGSRNLTGSLQLSDSVLVGADHVGSSYGPANATLRGFQITNSAGGG